MHLVKVTYMENRIYLDMKNKTQQVKVSASEVSEAFFCSYRLRNRLNGVTVSKRFKKSAKRGDSKHEYQNRIGRDKRCFISTYALGDEHPDTVRLRVFRDQVLMTSFIGRLIVRMYYLISPRLVHLCANNPSLDKLVKKCLKSIISVL